MARLMLEKSGLKIVAAVDGRPDFVGKDLGEVLGLGKKLGVTVTNQPEDVLDKKKSISSSSRPPPGSGTRCADLRKIITAGINCITIAEEMADPEAQSPELAARARCSWPKSTA